MEQITILDAVKGETTLLNLGSISITVVGGADKVWFTAKKHKTDLDSAAAFQKGMNVPGLSGITLLTNPQILQVTINPADIPVTLIDRALIFDMKIKQVSTGVIDTVVSGVLYLVDAVNQTAA
jgi:hypothetical protein